LFARFSNFLAGKYWKLREIRKASDIAPLRSCNPIFLLVIRHVGKNVIEKPGEFIPLIGEHLVAWPPLRFFQQAPVARIMPSTSAVIQRQKPLLKNLGIELHRKECEQP